MTVRLCLGYRLQQAFEHVCRLSDHSGSEQHDNGDDRRDDQTQNHSSLPGAGVPSRARLVAPEPADPDECTDGGVADDCNIRPGTWQIMFGSVVDRATLLGLRWME
jgi:hypothetical protein